MHQKTLKNKLVPAFNLIQAESKFLQVVQDFPSVWSAPFFFFFTSFSLPFATEGKEVIAFTNLALGCTVKAICQSESVKLTLGSRYLRLAAVGFDILYYT